MKKFSHIKNIIFNYKTFLVVFLLIMLRFIIQNLYRIDNWNHPWILADWLINFQDGGFKRRGLSGSLFFAIQDITNFKLHNIVFVFQSIAYIIFITFTSLIILSKKINFNYILLIISPLSFLNYYYNTEILGRKEVLFFAIFSYFVYLISNNKLTKIREIIILILIPISLLFHELIIFYLPYFIMTIILYSDTKNSLLQNIKNDYKRYLAYTVPSVILIVLIFFFGIKINYGNSIDTLISRGLNARIGEGVLSWKTNSIEHLIANKEIYSKYIFVMIYMFVHFYIFLKNEIKEYSLMIKFFIFAFLLSIPLYISALDWGRWFHIHFMAMLIITTSKMNNNKNFVSNRIKINKINFCKISAFVFLLSWYVGHWNTAFYTTELFKKIINLIS